MKNNNNNNNNIISYHEKKHKFVFCQYAQDTPPSSLLWPTHHTAVEVLVHLAEGVRRCLPLARDDDTDIGDSQRRVGLALGRAAVRDVDALGGRAAYVGRATGRRGLDDVTSWLQLFLPLVQHSGKQTNKKPFTKTNSKALFVYCLCLLKQIQLCNKLAYHPGRKATLGGMWHGLLPDAFTLAEQADN